MNTDTSFTAVENNEINEPQQYSDKLSRRRSMIPETGKSEILHIWVGADVCIRTITAVGLCTAKVFGESLSVFELASGDCSERRSYGSQTWHHNSR